MSKYREDKDLVILQYADNEMLEVLVDGLIYDEKGKRRLTESLSSNKKFQEAGDDYRSVWRLIAAELQHYGGNTLVNVVRKQGVLYRNILIDVCKKIKVKADYKKSTSDIEKALIIHIFSSAWNQMSDEEKDDVMLELGLARSGEKQFWFSEIFAGVEEGRLTRPVTELIAKSVRRKKDVKTAVIGGLFGVTIGLTLTTILALPLISGAAYRVTIPACIQIASIRQQLSQKTDHFN